MAVAVLEPRVDRRSWIEEIREISASIQEAAVLRVVEAMHADLEFPFTLDTFAEMANYSPFHFARMFRDVTGIPPGEFLSALRFQRAKELVLTTDLSITDICFEVGFSSLGTFSSRFKQLVGTNPAQLRCLPHLIDALPRNHADIHLHTGGSGGSVSGMVGGREPVAGMVYIGLYPTAIAQNVPVRGVRISGAGAFHLPAVPKGTYRLMAAVIPSDAGPVAQLLPDRSIQVAADPEPLAIRNGHERIERTLSLRPLRAVEPPILTALPALAINRATQAWR